MAFTLPTFNLLCDVYTGPWVGKVFRFQTDCNLQAGRRSRTFSFFNQVVSNADNGPAWLLVPAGTDLRELSQGIADNDLVEVPSGSGRWYAISHVDDVGKGFPNEFRYAEIYKVSEANSPVIYPGLFWPIPMP